MKTICLLGICLTKTAIILEKEFTKYAFRKTAVMTVGTVLEKTACLGKVKPKCLPVKGSHFHIRLSVNITEGTGKFIFASFIFPLS